MGLVRDGDGRETTDERCDAQGFGVGGEVGRNLAVGRGHGPSPRLKVVEVGAIGPLRRCGDACLDIRLDLGRKSILAVNCMDHDAVRLRPGVREDLLRGLGSLGFESR